MDFRYSPRRAHVYEAVIVAGKVGWLIVLTFVVRGPARYVAIVLFVLVLGVLMRRAFRLELFASRDEVTIRNYWRDYSFAWTSVKGVGIGSVMALPAIGFVLTDGNVRCAQVSFISKAERLRILQSLRRLAPPDTEFTP